MQGRSHTFALQGFYPIHILKTGGYPNGTFQQKNKAVQASADGDLLNITTSNEGTVYTLTREGRVDTNTSPVLEEAINEVIGEAQKLILDFEKIAYISGAGLRVLLGAAQAMEGKGEMVVCNLTESVQEVFELTGFNNLFNI